MDFRLETLPTLGKSRRPFLKDSGGDEYYDESDLSDTSSDSADGYADDDASLAMDDTQTMDETGETPTDSDGGTVFGEDGSATYQDPDGTQYYQDAEGNMMVTNPDGSGYCVLSDGTGQEWDANGNPVETAAMGPEAPETATDTATKTAKTTDLAQKAFDAASKAMAKNPTPSSNTPKPAAILAKKNPFSTLIASKTGTSGATLAGLSVGTVLAIGAVGMILYNFTKKRKG